jgi:hypothetical protein
MPVDIPNRKPEIVRLLRLLASEEQQLAYERDVPIADVPAELCCMWFDDQYHPDDSFFCSCFTADELAALAEFDRFYGEQKRLLPEDKGTIRTWLASSVWRAVMRKACETLERVAA